jgi:sugar O-acyltransferase (sialic acid O-acetyltransferase NeuD family)
MKSHKPTYVYGAGGHGKVVAEAARRGRAYELRAFLDDDRRRWGQEWDGLPILGGLAALNSLEDDAVIALGLGSNSHRARVAQAVLLTGRRLATVVHPAAVVAAGASLGEGTYVAPLAVLHSDAWVGRGCIVNTGAVVDHDCRLGDWVHVSPHATLGGGVRVGDGAHVGLGAVLNPGLSLGAWATLGAGAVMVASLPGAVTAMGVPARIRQEASR